MMRTKWNQKEGKEKTDPRCSQKRESTRESERVKEEETMCRWDPKAFSGDAKTHDDRNSGDNIVKHSITRIIQRYPALEVHDESDESNSCRTSIQT
jgi:hypothetical protein